MLSQEELITEAEELESKGALLEALLRWRQALAFSADPYVRARLGRACIRAGQVEDGERYLREVIAAVPDSSDAWFYLGVSLHERGECEQARKLVEKSVALEPWAPALVLLGEIYRGRGCNRVARCSFRRAAELEPDNSEAWYGIGLTLRFCDSDLAANMFRESIRTDPSHSAAYRELGHMLWRTGNLDAAEQSVRKALELDPVDAWAHNYLGHLLVARGAMDEAITAFEAAIGQYATPFFYSSLGDLLVKQNRLDEADGAYKDALALDTSDGLSNLRYGQFLKRRRRLRRASKYLRRALHANPRDRRPQLALDEIADLQANILNIHRRPISED